MATVAGYAREGMLTTLPREGSTVTSSPMRVHARQVCFKRPMEDLRASLGAMVRRACRGVVICGASRGPERDFTAGESDDRRSDSGIEFWPAFGQFCQLGTGLEFSL